MRIARVVVVLVLVALALGIGFIYSGLFDVGATWPDDPVGAWVFRTTAKHSVRRHARGIAAPSLSDPNLVATGSGLYSLQCALCHGDVGTPPGDAGKGLRPRPPELAKTAGEWSGPQLFWIVKNGIRMTGMPAWGAAYPDRDLWAIVAYTAGLPTLSATPRRPPAPAGKE